MGLLGKLTIFRKPPFIPLKLLWEAAQERIDLEEAEARFFDPEWVSGRIVFFLAWHNQFRPV